MTPVDLFMTVLFGFLGLCMLWGVFMLIVKIICSNLDAKDRKR